MLKVFTVTFGRSRERPVFDPAHKKHLSSGSEKRFVKHRSILQNFTSDQFFTGFPSVVTERDTCPRYSPGFAGENTFIFDASILILPDDEKALG